MNIHISGGRKLVIFLVIVILVGVGGWIGWKRYGVPKLLGPAGPVSTKILGVVTAVQTDKVTVHGFHIQSNNTTDRAYADIVVAITAQTKLMKTVSTGPAEPTKDTTFADYKTQTTVGAFSDLKKNVSVIVNTTENTISSKVATASQIEYISSSK